MFEKLLKVQMEIGAIKKDATNPFYKSKYFDINSLLEQVKPILNKHGIVLLQALTNTNGKNCLTTQIINAETETILDGGSIILPDIQDPQKIGSAITYFRRYALQSLLALEAEDDDGNFASKTKAPSKPVKVAEDDEPF